MAKLSFPLAPLALASAASQAKIVALAGVFIQVRVRAAEFAALADYRTVILGRLPGKNALKFGLATGDPGTFRFHLQNSTEGPVLSSPLDRTLLPTTGDFVATFAWFTGSGNLRAAAGLPDGAELVAWTGGFSVGALPTGAGSGVVELGPEVATNYLGGLVVDAVAIGNANRAGVSRFARMLPTDADTVAIYYMGEGSGGTTADAIAGGTALTLANTAWVAEAGWDGATAPAPNPRVGFSVVSGYPALNAIPNNATLVPPLVLQAVDAGNVATTAGAGDTVEIGVDVVITGALVVSGGSAVQAADGRVTFSSLVLAPVTNLTGTATRAAAAGVATFNDLKVRFR